jgi:hypothetical protein
LETARDPESAVPLGIHLQDRAPAQAVELFHAVADLRFPLRIFNYAVCLRIGHGVRCLRAVYRSPKSSHS